MAGGTANDGKPVMTKNLYSASGAMADYFDDGTDDQDVRITRT